MERDCFFYAYKSICFNNKTQQESCVTSPRLNFISSGKMLDFEGGYIQIHCSAFLILYSIDTNAYIMFYYRRWEYNLRTRSRQNIGYLKQWIIRYMYMFSHQVHKYNFPSYLQYCGLKKLFKINYGFIIWYLQSKYYCFKICYVQKETLQLHCTKRSNYNFLWKLEFFQTKKFR